MSVCPLRPGPSRRALAGLALLALASAACEKKKEAKPRDVPPPLGAASTDELTTKVGVGSGLDAQLASSSTRWEHAFVTGPRSAAILGSTPTERVVLMTDDGGRTFRALREPKQDFSSLDAAAGGTLVLASGTRLEPPKSSKAPRLFVAADVRFTDEDRRAFGPPVPWQVPDAGAAKKAAPPEGFAEAAVAALGPGAAALLAENARRRGSVRFVGGEPPSPSGELALPPGERIVPMPFGRPPALLSARGATLLARPLPSPGAPSLPAPRKVDGLAATPEVLAALSAPPCAAGEASAALVPRAGGKSAVLVASAKGTRAFSLPPGSYLPGLGCAAGAVVALRAGKEGIEAVRCDLEGKCVSPKTPAFRSWQGPHDKRFWSVPTPKGAVIALERRAGERWELAVSHSTDDLETFDLPRVVGEGTTSRGSIDLGALLALEDRLLLLVSADVTGTTRRGLYVLASDDGGLSWGPP